MLPDSETVDSYIALFKAFNEAKEIFFVLVGLIVFLSVVSLLRFWRETSKETKTEKMLERYQSTLDDCNKLMGNIVASLATLNSRIRVQNTGRGDPGGKK